MVGVRVCPRLMMSDSDTRVYYEPQVWISMARADRALQHGYPLS